MSRVYLGEERIYHIPKVTDVKKLVREHLLGRPNSEVLNSIPISSVWGETTLSGEALERQLSLAHSTYACSSQELGCVILVGLNKVNDDLSADYYWCVGWDDHDVGKSGHWLQDASGAAKHDCVMNKTESLEPKFREIFQLTPVTGILPGQAIYRDLIIPSLPAGRIILVGDAAHAMTPCKFGSIHLYGLKDMTDCLLKFEGRAACKRWKMRSIYLKG